MNALTVYVDSILHYWSKAFFTAQLIVGPSKINPKLLRQTFGERFLFLRPALEIANKFEPLSIANATVQTHITASTNL